MIFFRRERHGNSANAGQAVISAQKSAEQARRELDRQRALLAEAQQVAAKLADHNASNHYADLWLNAMKGRSV